MFYLAELERDIEVHPKDLGPRLRERLEAKVADEVRFAQSRSATRIRGNALQGGTCWSHCELDSHSVVKELVELYPMCSGLLPGGSRSSS